MENLIEVRSLVKKYKELIAVDKLDLDVKDYIKDESRTNMDPINIFFYTLVGMTTIYGYMWGLYVIYQYEANLSVNAKRNVIAPIKKSVSLLASILASWIINFVITLIFIFYLDKVLGVEFGGKMPLLVLLSLVSSLAGVGLGILIGVSKTALTLGKIFPSYYYIRNNEMLLENPSFVTILPNIGVMLAFSIGFVLISLLMKTKTNDKIS